MMISIADDFDGRRMKCPSKCNILYIRYALDITYQTCFCHLLYPEDIVLSDEYSYKINAKFMLE